MSQWIRDDQLPEKTEELIVHAGLKNQPRKKIHHCIHVNMGMVIYLNSDLKGIYSLDNQIIIKIKQLIEIMLQAKVSRLYLYMQ